MSSRLESRRQYAKLFLISFPRPKALRFIDFPRANAFDISRRDAISFGRAFQRQIQRELYPLSIPPLSTLLYPQIRSARSGKKTDGKKNCTTIECLNLWNSRGSKKTHRCFRGLTRCALLQVLSFLRSNYSVDSYGGSRSRQ